MIGEMAFSTAQENGNDPGEQSRQSQESQVFANPYIPLTLLLSLYYLRNQSFSRSIEILGFLGSAFVFNRLTWD